MAQGLKRSPRISNTQKESIIPKVIILHTHTCHGLGWVWPLSSALLIIRCTKFVQALLVIRADLWGDRQGDLGAPTDTHLGQFGAAHSPATPPIVSLYRMTVRVIEGPLLTPALASLGPADWGQLLH